jgi:hypothetical protein
MGRQKVMSPEIDGYRYAVLPFMATEGRRISLELVRAIGPALAHILGDGPVSKATIADLQVSPDAIGHAINSAFNHLSLERIDALIARLAEQTDAYGDGFGDAGAPLDKQFDEHFAARYKAMYQWLMFALRVNFADFFPGGHGGTVQSCQPSAARR